MLSKEYCR